MPSVQMGCISDRVKSVNGKSAQPKIDLSQRCGGVLLHVSSLPGKFGIGDLGPAAHRWVDLLASAGQRWWQILPLGYAEEGGSPYRCFSAFAGNPLLISPEQLVAEGLLVTSELRKSYLPDGKIQFKKVTQSKLTLLKIAHQRFEQQPRGRLAKPFRKFLSEQSAWLDDFALFMALRSVDPAKAWTDWPTPILRRHASALDEARLQHADAFEFHRFVQFIFARQLQSLRDHARTKGVALIGDLPIFISPESSDVWTNPRLFLLDPRLRPRVVSGVPPDMFSATGQRWGNPLYNWKEMAKDNFAWWKARLDAALKQADLVRIDHFRGLESCWSIPSTCPTAQEGKWSKSPGVELFAALLGDNLHLPLVAEDLGIITPQVEDLRDRFNLPGMRVLQFGFSGSPGDIHTPHNFIRHCFAYTGTHDNDTTAGWYKLLPAAAKQRLENYAPHFPWKTDAAWSLIQLLWASTANNVIAPVQDLLNLGSDARMNIPGRSNHNWTWRLDTFDDCKRMLARLEQLTQIYDRNVRSSRQSFR